MGFAKLIFTSLVPMSAAMNPESKHYVTLDVPRVRLGEPKRLDVEKLSRLPGLPYLPR